MAPPDLTARPFGLAEVIDRSVAIGLRHFRPLFLAMLVIQAPALVLARQLPGLELLSAAGDPERAAQLLAPTFRGLSAAFLTLLALQLLATAAAAAIVAPTLDPRRGAPRPTGARRLVAAVTATGLQIVLLGAAPVAGALPGLALAIRAGTVPTIAIGVGGAVVGGLGLFLVATLRLMLVPAVAAVEGRGGLAALARSSRLMSPLPGSRLADRPGVRASLVLLAMFVLAVVVNGLAGIPRMIALRVQGGEGGLALLGAHLPLPLGDRRHPVRGGGGRRAAAVLPGGGGDLLLRPARAAGGARPGALGRAAGGAGMTALLLAAALAAAAGCPAAQAQAASVGDSELAGDAAAVAAVLEAGGAGGPADALHEEAARAGAAGASDRRAAGARFRVALLRHCTLAAQEAFPAPSPADRARAAEILDRPAFRRARADPDALRRWLLEQWQRFLELTETGEAQRYASFGRAVFLAAAAIGVAVGLLALLRRRTSRPAAPAPVRELASPVPDARLDRAEEAAARGQGARAVRLAFLAALAALERRGAVPPGRALTNQELVDQLRAEPARIEALRTLSRLFDRCVYGGAPAGAAEAAAALRAARALGAEASR